MSSARHVYTVCGHWKQEDECPTSKNNKSGALGKFFNRFGGRAIPTRPETIYLPGFCEPCRIEYDVEGSPSNLDLHSLILNYWAFKNWLGISEPVPASQVPASIVFDPSSRFQYATNRRLEIAMLANQLACSPSSGSIGELLHRLEIVRETTLEWASSLPSPCSYPPSRSHIFRPEQDATIQPQQVHETTLSILCGGPVQVHEETLSILCGGPVQNERAAISPKDETNTPANQGLVSRFSVSTVDSDHSSNDEMAGQECIVVYYQREDFPEFRDSPEGHISGPPAGNWI